MLFSNWHVGRSGCMVVTFRKLRSDLVSSESLSLERRFWVPVPMSYGHRWLQDKTDMILRVHEK